MIGYHIHVLRRMMKMMPIVDACIRILLVVTVLFVVLVVIITHVASIIGDTISRPRFVGIASRPDHACI